MEIPQDFNRTTSDFVYFIDCTEVHEQSLPLLKSFEKMISDGKKIS